MSVEQSNIFKNVKFENYLRPRQQGKLQKFKNTHKIPRIPTKCKILKNTYSNKNLDSFENYCQIASIHGFANLLHTNLWQRCFWWLIIISATVVTLYFFMLDVVDLKSKSAVTFLKSLSAPIANVAFPSVTVCHFNRISKHRAENFAAELLGNNKSMSQKEMVSMFRAALWYDTPIQNVPAHVYVELQRIMDLHNMTLEDLLIKISPKCFEFFTHCMWRGRRILCRKAFKQVLTMQGLCCQAEVSTLVMHPSEQSEQATALHRLGLKFMLTTNQSDYTALVYPNADFLVRVHNSKDTASMYEKGYFVRVGLTHEIKVQLNSRWAASNLRSFAIEKRGCVLQNEGIMRWYNNEYTRRKCQIDCWISAWYSRCGCVLPFFPRPFPNISVCGLSEKDRSCYYDPIIEPVFEYAGIDCTCLPACQFISVISKMSTMKVDRSFSYNMDYFYDDYSANSNAVVNIFYEKLLMTNLCVEVYKTRTALLASMGGVAGLQLGFSVISLNEILFFALVFPLGKWLNHVFKHLKKKFALRFRGKAMHFGSRG